MKKRPILLAGVAVGAGLMILLAVLRWSGDPGADPFGPMAPTGASGDAASDRWRRERDPDSLDAVIRELESRITADPENLEARQVLAEAYLLKLKDASPLAVPGWAARAEDQWRSILEREEDHWSARYSLAMSYSHYPAFLNKLPEAIAELERLRQIQERQEKKDYHALTYLQLTRFYLRQGRTEAARRVRAEGLERHPDHRELRDQTVGDE